MAPANPIATLGYAILGLLARQPLSGYDLAARLKVPVGFYWTAHYSQIRPELQKLQHAGLVTHKAIPGPGPHSKKVYTITQPGLEALRAWLTQPPKLEAPRNELLLKTHSLWLAGPGEMLPLFRAAAAVHAEHLAHYEAVRERMEVKHGERLTMPDTPEFAEYATLRRGIGFETECLAWCGWMIQRLEDYQSRGQRRHRDLDAAATRDSPTGGSG